MTMLRSLVGISRAASSLVLLAATTSTDAVRMVLPPLAPVHDVEMSYEPRDVEMSDVAAKVQKLILDDSPTTHSFGSTSTSSGSPRGATSSDSSNSISSSPEQSPRSPLPGADGKNAVYA